MISWTNVARTTVAVVCVLSCTGGPVGGGWFRTGGGDLGGGSGSGSGSTSGSGIGRGSSGGTGSTSSSSSGGSSGHCTASTATLACGTIGDTPCLEGSSGGVSCCSPDSPYECQATCYQTEAAAVAACGSGSCVTCAPSGYDGGLPPSCTFAPSGNGITQACSDCLLSACGSAWCTCFAETQIGDASVNDRGCLAFFGCVNSCVANGQGSQSMCQSGCAYVATPAEQSQANVVNNCFSASCNTAATCGS